MSEFRDDDLYGIEGPNTGRIQDKLRDPARLKNWWDQYALEAADRIDWLERELCEEKDRVSVLKTERDEAWHAFRALRQAYAEYRYPGMQASIKLVEMLTPDMIAKIAKDQTS